jgi:hypothetical protein
MQSCLECGNSAKNKFCTSSCSNKYQGKKRLKENAGSNIICGSCLKPKPPRFFSYNIRGVISSGKKSYCKACGLSKKVTAKLNRTWKNDAAQVLMSNSKQRARKAGLEHTLKYEDIQIPNVCPVLGIPLHREGRETWLNAPSLDRVDNTLGYTPDNVVVISRRANILKKDATIDELIALAQYYSARRTQK